MFKFRLLLLWVGVLGAESIYQGTVGPYQGDIYSSPYSTANYNPPSYPNYASPPNNYGAPNTANCAYMKVLEVLDSIFCQHGERRRYTSTIYPSIELLIDELEWISAIVFIPNVYQLVGTAADELKALQDATKGTYGDSSLLQPYEFLFPLKETATLEVAAGPSRAAANEKLTSTKAKLSAHEENLKTYKTKHGMLPTATQEAEKVVEQNVNENAAQKEQVKRRALIKAATEKLTKPRMTRGTEGPDYTCALLPPIYCSEEKYDDLLYNMLDRIFGAVNVLDQALWESWLYIFELDCSSDDNKWAIMEASSAYGMITTAFYSLLEVAFKIERIYEIVELEGAGSSGFYRAGGSSMQMTNRRPAMISVNRAPAQPQTYPFNGYGPVMQQYRAQRAVPVAVAVPYPSYSPFLATRTG